MGVIKNIDTFKKIELFRAKAEICYDSKDSYLNLIIQPYKFSNAEFNQSLLEFSEDDIFGKTTNEFLIWLKEKADEEGYELGGILEDEFSVSRDNYLIEKMFDFKTKELISDTSALYENDSFYVDCDEIEDWQPYFFSFEEATRFLKEKYPLFKIEDAENNDIKNRKDEMKSFDFPFPQKVEELYIKNINEKVIKGVYPNKMCWAQSVKHIAKKNDGTEIIIFCVKSVFLKYYNIDENGDVKKYSSDIIEYLSNLESNNREFLLSVRNDQKKFIGYPVVNRTIYITGGEIVNDFDINSVDIIDQNLVEPYVNGMPKLFYVGIHSQGSNEAFDNTENEIQKCLNLSRQITN
jgi:hypothetical protein